MNLEDIKTQWKKVKKHIDPQLDVETVRRNITKGQDAKSRLLKRSFWSHILVFVCVVLMATSRIWSPMKLPYWWLGAFCLVFFFEMLCSIKGYRKMKKINLWEDSNAKIMEAIVSLKKDYRNMELRVCIVVGLLLLWISFTPYFINTWRMYYVWSLILVEFVLEFFWYRSNMKLFNNIIDWK